MLRKLLVLSLLLSLSLSSVCFAVSTEDTNLDVLDNGKSLYGEKVNGQGKQLIGINGSDAVVVDESGLGVQFGGSAFSIDIQEVSPNASATTSMTSDKLLIYNGAKVGTANIVLPASPSDGQTAKIITKPAITISTVTAGAITVNGGATSFSANTAIEYTYSATTTEWHKSQ